jgi:dipeptidyl aminopeptidase/acylaminoacyl peptidase
MELRRFVRLAAACWLLTASHAVSETRPFTAEDLVAMDRIEDPQPSPDGRWVAYVLRTTDLEANGAKRDLWLVDAGGEGPPRRLTTHSAADVEPRWASDGGGLYFLSPRSGSMQVWYLPIDGGEARQVTRAELDVANLVVSGDGKHLAFTMEVYVDCEDPGCTAGRLKEREDSAVGGRLYERMFVRHWDTWKDGRRSHLFVQALGGDASREAGPPVDVSAGLDADVPSKPFGDSSEIAFAPDGKGLVFAARDAGAGEPWSTDFDLWYAPIDGSAAPRELTDNPAWDTLPSFSPDGKTLAYLAMERAGFEADRFRIVLRAWQAGGRLGPPRILAEDWDRSAGSLAFSDDGQTLFVTAGDVGNVALFAIDVASGDVEKLVGEGHVRSPSVAGDRLVFGLDDMGSPVQLFSTDLRGGDRRQLTRANEERLAAVKMGEYEQFSFAGWNGETVYGYVVRPADQDPGGNAPVAFLIHGGPQGSFGNDFHYRWNPQVYAGAGYAAVMIDFHGSTGYGQAFTDAIRDDWGGKPLEDLQKGLAAALERYPWLDGDRVCALGASYGGYMINWIAGNWSDRFRCLVNHDGLFDLSSMYYSTEELWFPEWEFRGTPYTSPETYARHNPADHVDEWQTPMLVVHGELDYRVPLTQGLATFTALQRRGIPSQLLYYPDENHWVLKPKNSIQWHDTVLAWLDRWIGEGAGE